MFEWDGIFRAFKEKELPMWECIYVDCPTALLVGREWPSADACVAHLIREHAHGPAGMGAGQRSKKMWVRHQLEDKLIYCCLYCKRTGSDSSNLAKHYETCHIKEAGKAECFHCERFWTTGVIGYTRHIRQDCPDYPKVPPSEDPGASVDVEPATQLRTWDSSTKKFIENPHTLLKDRQWRRLKKPQDILPNHRISKSRALVPQPRGGGRVAVLLSHISNATGTVRSEFTDAFPSNSTQSSLPNIPSHQPRHSESSGGSDPLTFRNTYHSSVQPMNCSSEVLAASYPQLHDINNFHPSHFLTTAADAGKHQEVGDSCMDMNLTPRPYNGFIPPGREL